MHNRKSSAFPRHPVLNRTPTWNWIRPNGRKPSHTGSRHISPPVPDQELDILRRTALWTLIPSHGFISGDGISDPPVRQCSSAVVSVSGPPTTPGIHTVISAVSSRLVGAMTSGSESCNATVDCLVRNPWMGSWIPSWVSQDRRRVIHLRPKLHSPTRAVLPGLDSIFLPDIPRRLRRRTVNAVNPGLGIPMILSGVVKTGNGAPHVHPGHFPRSRMLRSVICVRLGLSNLPLDSRRVFPAALAGESCHGRKPWTREWNGSQEHGLNETHHNTTARRLFSCSFLPD